MPYIMDLTFSKYDFQKNGEQITGYSISGINIKIYQSIIYTELPESSLKPFSFFNTL